MSVGDLQMCVEVTAGVCTATAWVPAPGAFPVLTVADAQGIALSIGLLWGVAFGLRMVRKVLQES